MRSTLQRILTFWIELIDVRRFSWARAVLRWFFFSFHLLQVRCFFFCCVHWIKIVLTRIHRYIKRFDCDFHLVVFWSHRNWLIRMRFSHRIFWFSNFFSFKSLNWNDFWAEISSVKWFEVKKNWKQSNSVRFSKECMVNLRQVHFLLQTMDLFHSFFWLKIEKSFEFCFCTLTHQALFTLLRALSETRKKTKLNRLKKNEKRSNFQCQKLSGTMNCVRILDKQRSHSMISLSLCHTTHPIFFLRDAFISNLYDRTHINAYTNVSACMCFQRSTNLRWTNPLKSIQFWLLLLLLFMCR